MWTDNDRNMSHFFMQAYSNFATYGWVLKDNSFASEVLKFGEIDIRIYFVSRLLQESDALADPGAAF